MNDLTVVDKPAEWDRLKAMVLDSVSSPITKRVYNMALGRVPDVVSPDAAAGFHESHRERVAGIA